MNGKSLCITSQYRYFETYLGRVSLRGIELKHGRTMFVAYSDT